MNAAKTPIATKFRNSLLVSSVRNSAMLVSTTSRLSLRLAFFSVLLLSFAGTIQAQTMRALYGFTLAKGAQPYASLIRDASGNLYGTTAAGGAYGYGTVFKVKPSGAETVLYSFTGGADGANPYAGLIQDTQGNFYGTTQQGGAYNYGTVFMLSATGTQNVLYSFTGGADGAFPYAALIADAEGTFYGTTQQGGDAGYGTVFTLTPRGVEKVLHSFTGADGSEPYASLIRDAQGNLYGTAAFGGAFSSGTVFMLTRSGVFKVLYNFAGGADGAYPRSSLIQDVQGNFYGTTLQGGAYYCGTLFTLTPGGVEKVLYTFRGAPDGSSPYGSLVQDAQGIFYGTTIYGGSFGKGTVFIANPGGAEKVVYSFTGAKDGAYPQAGLIQDAQGNFYGTTWAGAYGYGTVFMLQP